MEDFKIIKTNEDWKNAIEEGYTTLISGVNYKKLNNGYISCNWDNLEKVFEEVTGHKYDQNDGTFGSAMPITETFGNKNLFNFDMDCIIEIKA